MDAMLISSNDEDEPKPTRRSTGLLPALSHPAAEEPSETTHLASPPVSDDITWVDDVRGVTYHYPPNPLTYSCPFILSQELCERLAYYGLTPTLKNFVKLTLNKGDSGASAYLGAFQGTMFVTPIISAALSDTFLGNFKTILTFSMVYILGLVCLLLATIESISQPWMVHLGLMVLVCFGAGGIKSCVNVFGAQQFHPVIQKEKITSFFTFFYASINIGSLVGGIACPQLADSVSYFSAYLIPLSSFTVATTVFVAGRSRYIQMLPRGSPVVGFARLLFSALRRRGFQNCKRSHGGDFEDSFVDACLALIRLLPLCSLEVPMLVAYNQMTTAFLTQGEKMRSVIFGASMAPAMMQNVDPVAVIVSSLLIEQKLYPLLRRRGSMPTVLTRFLIGNLFGALSLGCAFVVERVVMSEPIYTISIWWQVPQFVFIAVGEVFLISTGYEMAFTYAPDELKTMSSACNLIFFALAGYISGGLFLACASWMPDFDATKPETYQDAHYDYYFIVLAVTCVVGAIGCVLFRPYFASMRVYALAKESPPDEAVAAKSVDGAEIPVRCRQERDVEAPQLLLPPADF